MSSVITIASESADGALPAMVATAWMLLTPSHRVMSIVQSPSASDTPEPLSLGVLAHPEPSLNIVIFTPGSAVPVTVNIAVLTVAADAVVMAGTADCTGGVMTGAGSVVSSVITIASESADGALPAMVATAWMLLTPSHRVMSIVQSPSASDTPEPLSLGVLAHPEPSLNIVIFTPGSAVPVTVNIAVLTVAADAVVMAGTADCTGGVMTGAGSVVSSVITIASESADGALPAMVATAWMLLTPSHRVMSIVQSPSASDTPEPLSLGVLAHPEPSLNIRYLHPWLSCTRNSEHCRTHRSR